MIIGNINNIKAEMKLYPPRVQEGLRFLMTADLDALPVGEHSIKGQEIFVKVTEYETQPKEERRPESHKKYIDIQYICAGEEIVGFTPWEDAGEVSEDLLAQKDMLFYSSVKSETEVVLTAGMFAILFPWDIHRANCIATEKTKVKKALVKIAMD